MKYELPALPYGFADLEPYIDARTMEIHYTKHHQAYADKLNAALDIHPELYEKSVEDLLTHLDAVPEDVRMAVRNHGGGYYNHTLFWQYMSPHPSETLSDDLTAAIVRDFHTLEACKDIFHKTAVGQFGSGWAWLIMSADKKLSIVGTQNQDNPISQGNIPLLGIDVWEHAYYLAYQNKRADYVNAWWHVVDWEQVSARYRAALERMTAPNRT